VPQLSPTQALCRHFGDCGGCQSQDVPYPAQLQAKQEILQGLYADFWEHKIPVTASPVLWHYRNKVDPSFAPKQYYEAPPKDFQRETVLGFKRKGRWFWPLEISECRIGPEGLGALLDAVRVWQRGQGLRAYDTRKQEGFLRALLVREGKRTGERMVVLITSPGDFDRAGFVSAVRSAYPATSIQRGISNAGSEVSFAEELEVLEGAPWIYEELHLETLGGRSLRFRISPMSFFQTNTLATESLYGRIREWAHHTQCPTLHDLYGGAGGIAFSCSDLVEQVWSVETVAAASEDGRVNAALNHIENVSFHTEKVEAYLKRCLLEGVDMNASAVVLDPSRAGLHPKALRRLLELRPPHVCYVSCNPKILAQELPVLLEHYTLTGLEGFDLFPHTRHVEVLAMLKRK